MPGDREVSEASVLASRVKLPSREKVARDAKLGQAENCSPLSGLSPIAMVEKGWS